MPASDLAPCGFGAFGTCCCTCSGQLILVDSCNHLGGTRKCGEFPEDEYVCIVFASESNIAMKSNKHGMCEGYNERKLPIVKEESGRKTIKDSMEQAFSTGDDE